MEEKSRKLPENDYHENVTEKFIHLRWRQHIQVTNTKQVKHFSSYLATQRKESGILVHDKLINESI